MSEYEFEVWQDGSIAASGGTSTPRAAIEEADRYEREYKEDGPVEVKFFIRNQVERDTMEELEAYT